MTATAISHLVFDVESVADGELIARVRYPGQGLTPGEAIERYQAEIFDKSGTTFIPHTFQRPIAVVIGKVDPDLRLIDVVSLDEPKFRSHVITSHFWRGWEMYRRPCWVTFNGRCFDIPIMEMSAFRYGVSLPTWFSGEGYKSSRNRFNASSHLDLQELLTNFGAAKLNGGLNLAAQMLNKPGKMGLNGEAVQKTHDEGGAMQISDYCRCDVLDTYFVFLRCMVLMGKITLERELELVAQTKQWIERSSDTCQAYRDYLQQWGDWIDPWEADSIDDDDEPSVQAMAAVADDDQEACVPATEHEVCDDQTPVG